jgi:hypothetical protein
MYHQAWTLCQGVYDSVYPILEHFSKDRDPQFDISCQGIVFTVWEWNSDPKYHWEHQAREERDRQTPPKPQAEPGPQVGAVPPPVAEAQTDDLSKLEHKRRVQIGANWKIRQVIDGLCEARSDEELGLIDDLVNMVIYSDDADTVHTYLKATMDNIDRADRAGAGEREALRKLATGE